MQKINCLLALLLIMCMAPLAAQQVALSGNLKDRKTGEAITGANVYLDGTTLGTTTDGSGNFAIRNIRAGRYDLIVSGLGLQRIRKEIELSQDTTLRDVIVDESSKSLGEVVVTGTGTPHHLKSAPVQTELITDKLIKAIAPSSFTDLMTGISPSFDFSPNTMGSYMQLNGLGNDFILVLIDGKRVYGDMGGQTDLNRINPANIERIEVVKGAASSLYGSEAIGGVINIITKKHENKINVENNTRIGSYGELIQHNSLDVNAGRFSSTTSYDRKESDGWQLSKYEIKNDKLVETEAKVQNSFINNTLSHKMSYAITQKLSIDVQGSIYESNTTRPLSVGKFGYYFEDYNYSAGAKYLLNKKDYITADWSSDQFSYYYKYNQVYQTYINGQKELQTEQTRDALNVKGVFELIKSNQITIGGEYVDEKLESAGRLVENTANVYTLAAYIQDEITITKKLNVVAGLRYVNHQEYGNSTTPKLSLMYKIADLNLRTTYSRGFKAPTLKELYYHYEKSGSLYLGNTDLNPQTSNYYAASAEYNKKVISTSVTVYQNDVEGLIDYQTIATSAEDAANGIKTTKKHYNINKAGTKGIDWNFDIHPGAGFTIGGGYSYVDAENKTSGTRLEYVARNYGNIRLGYEHEWPKYHLNANINGRFQDEKYFDDGNAKAFNVWKLTTIHRLITNKWLNLEVTAGIDNLFDFVDDSIYGSHYATLTPGRTWFAGVKIGFSK